MAGYTGGGGGGGSSVVPASLVVASDREDFPLTEAGLVAAIAALPAGGGDIYVGAGTLTITTAIVLSKNLRIFCAGVGVTIFAVTTGISMFTVGDVNLEMSDFSVTGNDTAAQAFLTLTADITANKYTKISNVRIGTSNTFGANGTKIIFDAAGFARNWYITDVQALNVAGGSFYANGASGFMRLVNVSANGALSNVSMSVEAVNTTITASGDINLYRQAKISGCRFNSGGTLTIDVNSLVASSFLGAVTLTSGTDCIFSACDIQVTTLTLGASSKVSGGSVTGAISAGASTKIDGVSITGAVTAGGSAVKLIGCSLASFTSSTAGRDGHVLKGNTFTGAGNNCTLTDCDSCVVEGNIACQVNETASSDSNVFANNTGFSGSTIVGPNDTVDGTKKFGSTGNSADAYATLLTFTSLKGLLGIGTIKNTDGAADQMTVEEQAIDFFGTTHTKETVVDAADDYLLDPQTNFSAAGGPPYSSYRVRVKSTSAGNPAPYSIQFAAQGVPA